MNWMSLCKNGLGVLLLLLCFEATAPGCSRLENSRTFGSSTLHSVMTYEDYFLEKAARVVKMDDVTGYVIQVCKQEGVCPLELLAILQVENAAHNPSAVNTNYRSEWSRKLRKNVRVVASRDIGLFQLNSLYIEHFKYFYWDKYGETEEFDPYNYKHNTRVAARLYKANSRALGNSLYYSVLAYNAGIGSVWRAEVPSSTSSEYWPLCNKYYTKMVR